MEQQPLVGHVLLFIEASRSNSDKPHFETSSGLAISSPQRPLFDIIQHSQETDIYALVGFEPGLPASERPHIPHIRLGCSGIGFQWRWLLVTWPIQVITSNCTVKHANCVIHNARKHKNYIGVDKKNQLDVTFVFFISLLIAAQHVSGNHVPIIRSWRLRDVIALCWYVPWLREGGRFRLVGSASMDALTANRS